MRRIATIFFLFIPTLTLSQGSVETVSFYSNSLGETRNMCIYLPEGYDPNDTILYPVIYFLHGTLADYTGYVEIYHYLDSMITNGCFDPMILVMPDGGVGPFDGSFYTNSELYGDFEDYIVMDLIAFIDSNYSTNSVRWKRSIMGHSMGGYGAMKLAFKHTDKFGAVVSHNGFLEVVFGLYSWVDYILLENGTGPPYTYNYNNGTLTNIAFTCAGAFSPNLNNSPYQVDFPLDSSGGVVDTVIARWQPNNLPTLAAQIPSGQEPAIYFDCGYGGLFLEMSMNMAFADSLALLNLDYAFPLFPGGHYNPDRFSISLSFLAEAMGTINPCDFSAEPLTGQSPLTVQFNDLSNPEWTITSWEWDFNNDGIVDSYDQNPEWTYNSAGSYSVELIIGCDTVYKSRVREDYVLVFGGESALLFDGEESVVTVPASPTINLTDQFTVEAWINPFGWGENPGTGFGRIVDKDVTRFFTLKSNPVLGDNTLCLWLFTQSGGNSFSAIPESSIVLNTWQHVATSYDGPAGEVKIYLNGSEQTITQTLPPSGALNDNSAIDLMIGNSASLINTFDGVIDEVRVWNVVRTAGEIQSYMYQYLDGSEPGLVGYWLMNEGNGQFVNDFTGNGNHGALSATEWVTGAPMGQTDIYKSLENTVSHNLSAFIYPNPFNSSVSIKYDLSWETFVEIDIYNVLGQKIENIVRDIKPAGENEAIWQAHNNPSGIYFYKINTAGGFKAGKMMLLK
ncbi:MAG: T9SS type A sorting domain-containing protein [Candidatus Zixiibacteriota bacterium]|nr:MAG: T9SS type A sorting domain-containing protein [candidate division Zixibacteria bacterium]